MASPSQNHDYHHGQMDISDQKGTFRGFMAATAWSSVISAMLLLFLVLHFCVSVDWFAATGAAVALGVVAGLAMNMGSAFIASAIGFGAILAIIGGVAGLVSLIGG